ncbi:hypothetical protein VL10_20840 [Leclercia adecarboxylata]|nr:hypothetical protein VL10_20840 [Leclercia adecarboxylata]KMN64136.1 hypothetical protein VK95_16435 [Leclercia sp. LK8]
MKWRAIVTKVILCQRAVKTHYEIKRSVIKDNKNNKVILIKFLKKITNSSAGIKRSLFGRVSCKKTANIKSFHGNIGRNLINSKDTRDFITNNLIGLDLRGKAKEDPVFARQTCDAVLASVYSIKKDLFCKKMISNNIDISGYLKAAGIAAREAGLEGKNDNNDAFVPAGAGANPFVSAVISSAQLKFPRVFFNKKQQAFFKQYAEKKISCEVSEICKDKGIISPVEFGVMLDKIASRYLLSQENHKP